MMSSSLTMADRLELLEEECLQLREQIAEMTRLPPGTAWPEGLALTRMEGAMLTALVARGFVTQRALLIATRQYGYTKDAEDVDIKVVQVVICKLRKKLRRFGVRIQTVWGSGYLLRPEDRARLLGEAA